MLPWVHPPRLVGDVVASVSGCCPNRLTLFVAGLGHPDVINPSPRVVHHGHENRQVIAAKGMGFLPVVAVVAAAWPADNNASAADNSTTKKNN